MANANFVVQNGLTVGPLTIDAATGSINTSGDINITGNLGVSQIAKNDSSVSINDTGSGSTIVIKIDGTTEQSVDANGVNLASGGYYSINGSSVLNATTLGSGVTASGLTSVGTLTGLTVSGTTALAGTTAGTLNATSGNIGTLAVTTGFSTANAVITGGSLNNTTVGATTHNTGRFTTITATTVNAGTIGNASAAFSGASATLTGTLIASTVNAGTIGNSGATLTGTLSTAAQNSVTTMTGLTGFGTASVVTTAAGHLTVTGNLTVNGTQNIINNTIYETTEYVVNQNATNGNIGTLVATTGFSAANAVITGGSINNATVGATTHTTGRFTTVTATTVNAGTIGNSGATLTGTLSTAAQTNITSVGTLTSLAVGAVTSSGTIIASTVNAGTIGNSGATLTGTLSTAAQTNVTSVGTLTGLTVSGAIVPNANLTINVGSVSAWFNTFYGVSTQAKYADLAENYQADKAYNPGTVLMFGGAYEVTLSDANTTAVAGVVSTNPAHLMNGQLSGSNVVPLALTGRVPCMVIGPVKKGDMMVSAGFGYAKSSESPQLGQVIGKALQDFPINAKGVIEVVVGRL